MSTTSRRTFARGAAWSIPGVAMAAPAPAVAASTATNVTLSRFTKYSVNTSGCPNGQYKLTWEGTTPGTYGLWVKNDRATPITVTGIYFVFLIDVDNLSLTVSSSYPQWSKPTKTGVTQTISGITYYQYRTDYTGTLTVPANKTGYLSYAFDGTVCRSGTTHITGGQGFGTVGTASIQSNASTVRTACTASNGCTPP